MQPQNAIRQADLFVRLTLCNIHASLYCFECKERLISLAFETFLIWIFTTDRKAIWFRSWSLALERRFFLFLCFHCSGCIRFHSFSVSIYLVSDRDTNPTIIRWNTLYFSALLRLTNALESHRLNTFHCSVIFIYYFLSTLRILSSLLLLHELCAHCSLCDVECVQLSWRWMCI